MNIDKDTAPFYVSSEVEHGLELMQKIRLVAQYDSQGLAEILRVYEHVSDVGIHEGDLAIITPQPSMLDSSTCGDRTGQRLCIFAAIKPYGTTTAWYLEGDELLQMNIVWSDIKPLAKFDSKFDKLYANALAIKEQQEQEAKQDEIDKQTPAKLSVYELRQMRQQIAELYSMCKELKAKQYSQAKDIQQVDEKARHARIAANNARKVTHVHYSLF